MSLVIRSVSVIIAGTLLLGACDVPESQFTRITGLKKVQYTSAEELRELRKAGAEIIVLQPDYVVIRTDSMENARAFRLESVREEDLVQRLVHIHLENPADVQKIVDTGIDLWEIKEDTAIAQAYDIYIERLRREGIAVTIVARDARNRGDEE